MGSRDGVLKGKANRLGLSFKTYTSKLAAGEKWCGGCQAWHSSREFGSDSSRADGLAALCLNSRNPLRARPTRNERQARLADGQTWCRRCADWVTDGRRGLCRKHRNEVDREQYAAHPSIKIAKVARKRGLPPVPQWWWEEIQELFGGMCAYGCGRPGTTKDHVIPVKGYGPTNPANVVPACRSCNSRKRANDPRPWILKGVEAFPEQWELTISLAAITASSGVDLAFMGEAA